MSARLSLISLIALLFTLPVWANPTPIGSSGRTVVPFQMKRLPGISIEKEKLIIEDAQLGSVPAFSGRGRMPLPLVRYSAGYVFNNKTKKPVTVKAGFPIVVYNHAGQADSNGGVDKFKVYYDGKVIPSSEIDRPSPRLYPKVELSSIADDLLKAKLAREVEIVPEFIDLSPLGKDLSHAKKAIEKCGAFSKKRALDIAQILDEKVYEMSDFSIADQRIIWYLFEINLPVGLSKELKVSYESFTPPEENYSISYILKTGSLWGDSVRNLEVVLMPDREFLKKGGKYKFLPDKAFAQSKDPLEFTLRRKNEKLSYNIHILRELPDETPAEPRWFQVRP